MRHHALCLSLCTLALACGGAPTSTAEPATPAATSTSTAPAVAPMRANQLGRADFNRAAAELALPLFWSSDANHDNELQADELAVIWGLTETPRDAWVGPQGFTERFAQAYGALLAHRTQGDSWLASLPPAERKRRALLLKELQQGRPSLIAWDFTKGSDEDREIVRNLLTAAQAVERIYQKQVGSFGLDKQIPADDTLSHLHFFLNQGPWCTAPATEGDPECSALPARPAEISGLYPSAIQTDKAFCEKLEKNPEHEALLDPFTAVEDNGEGSLVAVPYNEFFKDDMKVASEALSRAAAAVKDPSEAAFKNYLTVTARAFSDNGWFAADEAWAKMNADNSKWYLRIGPDEVYFEPCNRKAGFHMSFARINPGSKEWQGKLTPLRDEMEQEMASLAGKPYTARKVSFQLPDFIDIVLNAGDSRGARGATIGQSLPNFGPVANEGRGRTVAMTNLYNDDDSKLASRAQAESLLCAETMAAYSDDPGVLVMSTVLHEAAHNLGPAHQYKVKGKTDDEVFGGPLASTLEELKAQTAALYYADWLVQKGVLERAAADRSHLRDLTWAMGHISRGMYTGDGKPKPYSQLAAIQLGFLVKEGAVTWDAKKPAANGKDAGCFTVLHDKMPMAVKKLAVEVFGIKGRGDKARALGLIKSFVDVEGAARERMSTITERWQREPQASFLYAIRTE